MSHATGSEQHSDNNCLAPQAAAEQVSSLHPEGVDLILNNAGCQEPVTRAIET